MDKTEIIISDVQVLNVLTVINDVIECPGILQVTTGLFFKKIVMFKYSCCQHSPKVYESLIMGQVLWFNKEVC